MGILNTLGVRPERAQSSTAVRTRLDKNDRRKWFEMSGDARTISV